MLQNTWRQSIQLEREHKCLFLLRKITKKRDNFQQTVASDPQADKICILVTSYFSRFLVHSVFLIKDAEILFRSFHSLFHNLGEKMPQIVTTTIIIAHIWQVVICYCLNQQRCQAVFYLGINIKNAFFYLDHVV